MNIYQIKLYSLEKIYYSTKTKLDLKPADVVIINANQTIEMGSVIKKEEPTSANQETIEILRKATKEDMNTFKELKIKASKYIPICQEKANRYNLETMKLLDADFSLDEKKLTFYFSAEGRVDFRDLVTDLVKTFKKIIRLQQIGARDEAKIIGGVGKCGRDLCCSSFLESIDSITLDVAKEQDIIFGSNKLSGYCGKLMCCLQYELGEYKHLAKNFPKVGEEIKYKRNKCRVVARNLLKQTYTVETPDGQRVTVEA